MIGLCDIILALLSATAPVRSPVVFLSCKCLIKCYQIYKPSNLQEHWCQHEQGLYQRPPLWVAFQLFLIISPLLRSVFVVFDSFSLNSYFFNGCHVRLTTVFAVKRYSIEWQETEYPAKQTNNDFSTAIEIEPTNQLQLFSSFEAERNPIEANFFTYPIFLPNTKQNKKLLIHPPPYNGVEK